MSNNANLPDCKRNKELLSAKTKEYYQKNKERISTQARKKYHSLSEEKEKERLEYDKIRRKSRTEEDKIKRRAYIRSWYSNLSEEVKNEKRGYAEIDIIQ